MKSVDEHTPGPWRALIGLERPVGAARMVADLVDGRPGLKEYRVVHFGERDGDAAADAELIAAAPDLLIIARAAKRMMRAGGCAGLTDREAEAFTELELRHLI